MRAIVVALVAVSVLVGRGEAQSPPDYLQCFKVKDTQAKAAYVADLDGLALDAGCTVKVPATLACVPSHATGVAPVPPGDGVAGPPVTAFGCYKLKCPKRPASPPFTLDDRFGDRAVTPGASKLVCSPAAVTTTTTVVTSTTSTTLPCLRTLQPGAVLSWIERNFDEVEIPPVCGGSTATCCAGGMPTSPCGPLRAEGMSASLLDAAGADRFDLRYVLRLSTVAGIPVSVLGNDCVVSIDTAQGNPSTIELRAEMLLSADRLRILSVGNVTLTGLSADDYSLAGNLFCTGSNAITAGLLAGFLEGVYQDRLNQYDVCEACDGTVASCPEVVVTTTSAPSTTTTSTSTPGATTTTLSYAFGCAGAPLPTTAPATITVSGRVVDYAGSPVAGAVIEFVDATRSSGLALYYLGFTVSDAQGDFTHALTTGGLPVSTWLRVTKAGYLMTNDNPPGPLDADSDFVVPLLTSANVAIMATLAGAQQIAGTGLVRATVTDCDGEAVAGATVTSSVPSQVRYEAGGQPSANALNTDASGRAYLFDVTLSSPPLVSAMLTGTTFRVFSPWVMPDVLTVVTITP